MAPRNGGRNWVRCHQFMTYDIRNVQVYELNEDHGALNRPRCRNCGVAGGTVRFAVESKKGAGITASVFFKMLPGWFCSPECFAEWHLPSRH